LIDPDENAVGTRRLQQRNDQREQEHVQLNSTRGRKT
jgi:hypothetical protein